MASLEHSCLHLISIMATSFVFVLQRSQYQYRHINKIKINSTSENTIRLNKQANIV